MKTGIYINFTEMFVYLLYYLILYIVCIKMLLKNYRLCQMPLYAKFKCIHMGFMEKGRMVQLANFFFIR